ncbi:methyltransferase domain-containing protein [Terrabacter sp. MAHUQ-38]|uniref:methyltransferase domain-containing protein n=1 Tax=unclassified Terrabacter TaxID=2630222 RepID=UPI00165D6FD8|nr:methyltransferase domain-containing protein [Terrabacter sp. MAHUQ-38]
MTKVAAGQQDNARTLAAYEQRAATYREQTGRVAASGDPFLERLDALAPPGEVLEIGSAYGRDADALERLGRRVRRTDATRAFVDMQRADGHEAEVLDVLTDPLTTDHAGPYAAVLANAVLLHFTPVQVHEILVKVRGALVPGGVLGFTVKVGDGSEWSTQKLGLPRFFQYWQAEPLRHAVAGAGFDVRELTTEAGATWDWLIVLATPRDMLGDRPSA